MAVVKSGFEPNHEVQQKSRRLLGLARDLGFCELKQVLDLHFQEGHCRVLTCSSSNYTAAEETSVGL